MDYTFIKQNNMKLTFISLLTILLTSQIYASYGNLLDSSYNSLSTSLSSSQGDVEGNTFGLSASVEAAEGLIFTYNYSDSDIDEILGDDIGTLFAEGTSNNFGMGYIFRNKDFHVIPFVKMGKNEYSIDSLELFEVDVTTVGVTFRKQMGENSVFNFSVQNINVEEHTITDANANRFQIWDDTLTLEDLSEAEDTADSALGDRTLVYAGIEVFYNKDISLTYAATSSDFDTTTLSIEASYNF